MLRLAVFSGDEMFDTMFDEMFDGLLDDALDCMLDGFADVEFEGQSRDNGRVSMADNRACLLVIRRPIRR